MQCAIYRSFTAFYQKSPFLLFDPIGFTAPVTLIPKLLLQITWSIKLSWDEPLPNDICSEYFKWVANIECLEQCRLSLYVPMNSSIALHVFCDANQFAYACCIFMRTEIEDKVQTILITDKVRVAPTEILTLPRLKLMAVVKAVRLYTFLKSAFEIHDFECYFWTDSTVVLAWITNEGLWSVLVKNRVRETSYHFNKAMVPCAWK
ncbi:unnamed protein product [Larinioides sclopetarius]|uniref:Uncharacterized protein n=1 Tax=Larinioides sclopetarius TaxID=280406 RepID=A0AAV1Z827_9ARAC